MALKIARIRTATVEFEIQSETEKDLFRGIAEIQEVFGETQCGLCKHDQLRYVVRKVADNEFYELLCEHCRGKLVFGVLKATPGKLFPIRKLLPNGKPSWKDGEINEHRGWTQWRGEVDDDSTPQPAPAAPSGPDPLLPAEERDNFIRLITTREQELKRSNLCETHEIFNLAAKAAGITNWKEITKGQMAAAVVKIKEFLAARRAVKPS